MPSNETNACPASEEMPEWVGLAIDGARHRMRLEKGSIDGYEAEPGDDAITYLADRVDSLTRELSESRARAVQGEPSAVELLRQIVALWDKTRARNALSKDHMNDFARLMEFTRRLIGAPEFGPREETTNG